MGSPTMAELLEARKKRLRAEHRISLLLSDFIDLEDEELVSELERETASVRETVRRLGELASLLGQDSRRRFENEAEELEDAGINPSLAELEDTIKHEHLPAGRAFVAKVREGLGLVTVKDAHELWELDRATDAFARSLEELDGKVP